MVIDKHRIQGEQKLIDWLKFVYIGSEILETKLKFYLLKEKITPQRSQAYDGTMMYLVWIFLKGSIIVILQGPKYAFGSFTLEQLLNHTQ